jgi:hypothetical protein
MNTNVGHTGTTLAGQAAGIEAFLTEYNIHDKLYWWIAPGDGLECSEILGHIWNEFYACNDVKLDLGFWHVDEVIPMGNNQWLVTWSHRGGHAVTVAGMDLQNNLIAISDPDNDAAENGGGVIRPIPGGHPLHPDDTSVNLQD